MENIKIPFSPVVMLIDASYLNKVGQDISNHFAPVVNRDLPKADLAVLLECMALDAGLSEGKHEIQVIFVYDSRESRMPFCTPSDLKKELHGVAFQSQLGEFSLYAFQTSDMASREELFRESLMLAGVSKDVKHLIAVPDEVEYGNALAEAVAEVSGKEDFAIFGMNPPAYEGKFHFEMLGFPLLQSLGIRAEEL